YMTRLMQVTFTGEWRGKELPATHHRPSVHSGATRSVVGAHSGGVNPSDPEEEPEAYDIPPEHAGPHESPRVMLVPLIVLAELAEVAGWVGTPWANAYASFVHYGEEAAEHHGANLPLMIGSLAVALSGIGLGRALYPNGRFVLAHLKNSRAAMALYRLSRN